MIDFTYDGKDYCLEFTRKSVETMERQGFAPSDISDKPMTTIPKLFRGAFLAHHSSVKNDKIDEIYLKFKNKNELFSKLVEMYNEPILSLLEEPEEDEGNIEWGANS